MLKRLNFLMALVCDYVWFYFIYFHLSVSHSFLFPFLYFLVFVPFAQGIWIQWSKTLHMFRVLSHQFLIDYKFYFSSLFWLSNLYPIKWFRDFITWKKSRPWIKTCLKPWPLWILIMYFTFLGNCFSIN